MPRAKAARHAKRRALMVSFMSLPLHVAKFQVQLRW
jgi:hypothetical protein